MKPILFNTEMVKAIFEGRKTVTRRLIKPSQMQSIAPDRCPNHTPEEFVNEKPLLFSPYCDMTDEDMIKSIFKAPYQVGDILYVRETWRPTVGRMHTISRDRKRILYTSDDHNGYEYKAHCFGISDFYFSDGFKECDSLDYDHMSEIISKGKWHPSIHMPKEAARIFLKVTDVRVERLQDITNKEAIKEGIEREYIDSDVNIVIPERVIFGDLWDSTIKKKDIDRYDWKANPWVWVIEFERIEKGGEEK